MDSPAVSLVLCTKNRAERLRSCLEYVARQNPSCAWELVVVDNGSTDRTGEILKEYATKAPFPTKVLYQAPPGKSRGLNQALQVTRGEIIALIDDDCYVAPDYIDRVHETFADPRIGFAGGRIDLFDPTDYPTTIKTSEQWELIKPRTFVLAGALQGANTMYRRQVLEEIGGFDPDLGPGSRFYGEELDVQTRASFAGWYGLYTPDVKVAHHHGRKAKDLPALFRAYSVGEGAYKAKLSLLPETRPVVLPLVIRNWYWLARKGLRRSYERRALMWEMQGFAGYLVYRLRKRITIEMARASASHDPRART